MAYERAEGFPAQRLEDQTAAIWARWFGAHTPKGKQRITPEELKPQYRWRPQSVAEVRSIFRSAAAAAAPRAPARPANVSPEPDS